ncbi:MAG: AAA family ATPase [Bacteroidota bacterium]
MAEINFAKLFLSHEAALNQVKASFNRSLETEIEWDQKLIGLKGARGVGKTTILLKYIKKHYGTSNKAIYVSLDNLYFSGHTLLEFATEFYRNGGEHLFLDEVHKYDNWSQELKNIYDSIPNLKVVFTSSSILEILKGNADLSRRVALYHLKGLSFREYLEIETGEKFPAYSLQELLQNHIEIASSIIKKTRPFMHWGNYLNNGYYPFYLQSTKLYPSRLMNVINLTLETDLIACKQIEASHINKLKKLLYIIATSTPFQPNVAKLSAQIETSRATVTQYFNHLSDASLVNLLRSDDKGDAILSKPDKVYLHNTNLGYCIASEAMNVGNTRETFFFNQVSALHAVSTPKQGDFLIDGKYTFEIGGKNKTDFQLKKAKNAFVVSDDIEIGFGNKLPLFLFGFLY